jgi:hypothetical protein
LKSSAAIAIIIFVLLNVLAWTLEAGYYCLELTPRRTARSPIEKIADGLYRRNPLWPKYLVLDDALEEFAALPKSPKVVLLGSSIMFNPFLNADLLDHPTLTNYLQPKNYHHALALDRQLEKSGFSDAGSFNLSSAGTRFTDCEMIVDRCLKGERLPEWLVLGVSPGSLLDTPRMETPCFKRLIVLPESVKQYVKEFRVPRGQVEQSFWERVSFIWFYRAYWQQKWAEVLSDAWVRVLGAVPFDMDKQIQFISDSYAVGFKIMFQGDNVEYQFDALRHLLDTCADRGIRVLVVNMPLGSQHLALLPAGYSAKFRSEIAAICKTRRVALLDLEGSGRYSDVDFVDRVHLGAPASKKFVNDVASGLMAARDGVPLQ